METWSRNDKGELVNKDERIEVDGHWLNGTAHLYNAGKPKGRNDDNTNGAERTARAV
jgi:hypothetical protein